MEKNIMNTQIKTIDGSMGAKLHIKATAVF